MRLRNSTCPAASAPCTWNRCFAMSKPIVVACSMDASFGGTSTPPPWHTDAVGGRPLHHPTEPFPTDVANGRYGGMGCHCHWLPTRSHLGLISCAEGPHRELRPFNNFKILQGVYPAPSR